MEGRGEGERERDFSSTYPFVILESNSLHQSDKEKIEKMCKRDIVCHPKSSRTLDRSWSYFDGLYTTEEKD